MAPAASSTNRRRGRAGAVALGLGLMYVSSSSAFVSGNKQLTSMQGPSMRVAMRAQEEESKALLKINEENTIIAASVLPGAIGFFIFGQSIWVAGALFVAGAWCARQQGNDVGEALKGTSEVSMGLLNFGAGVVDKYAIGDKIGNAFNSALEKTGNQEAATKIREAVENVKESIADVDEDVGILSAVGNIVGTGGELANKAVNKVVSLSDEFKITEQIQAKFDDLKAKQES